MKKIHVLLLTGENNHDWKRSSAFVKSVLEASGGFEVTLTEHPSEELEDAAALKTYDVLFDDYNGLDWSEKARANFEAAVEGGTGLVVLHAASNPFKGWVAFEKMCGVMWRDGSSHGQFHEFAVEILDTEHPVTKGMTAFRTMDELYHKLVPMHGVAYHVLASAYSDPEKGGSGRDEPVLVVNQYGKGRIFHQALGHVWPGDPNGPYKGASMIAVDNEPFRKSIIRGTEWAATGRVSIA